MSANVDRCLTQRRCATSYKETLPRLDTHDSNQSRPGRGVRLRHCRKNVPWELGLDRHHVGARNYHQLRITPIQTPTHSTHDRNNPLTGLKLVAWIIPNNSHTLDASNLSDIAPEPGSKVRFRVIDPEGPHLDHHLVGFWPRIRPLLDRKNLRSTVLPDDDCAHVSASC